MGTGPDEDDRYLKEHVFAEFKGAELGVVLCAPFSPSSGTGPDYLHTYRGEDYFRLISIYMKYCSRSCAGGCDCELFTYIQAQRGSFFDATQRR